MPTHRYSIYGLICSPTLSEKRASLLHDACSQTTEWAQMPQLAAKQQVGPLIYWHLKEYGIQYPTQVRRALAAMYARQKATAQAQAETLAEIVNTFTGAGIESVVIKGGALAHILYAEPGLRPMEDLDILVSPQQAEQARNLLVSLGFSAPAPSSRFDLLQHHYPLAQRRRGDFTVSVELHTSAFNLLMRDKLSVDNMMRPLRAYKVLGQTAHTLNPLQMLWMQYLGLRKLAEPLRYIHLADLVGMAQTLADEVDWERLRQVYPGLWNAYEAVHAFSPLSLAVCEQLGLQPDNAPAMDKIGHDFQGWPRHGFSEQINFSDRRQLVAHTLLPPEWWARLIYGVRSSSSMAAILLYHHPAAFLHQGLRRIYLGPVNSRGFFKAPV